MPVENRDEKKRRTTATSIDSISDDDLITILVKLPAQDIHDVGRLVCRRWYGLIRSPELIQSQLQSSPAGILIQCKCKSNDDEIRSEFVGMNQKGRIETCYKPRYKFKDTVLSSCNGLVLLGDHDRNRLFVANPATKQHFSIPDVFGEGKLDKGWFMCLGYIEASKEYKVVVVKNQKECDILTVGVDDSWRPGPVQAEWDQWTDIDLADKVRTHESFSSTTSCILNPVGWLKYKQVLLFECDQTHTFAAYNLSTGELESFELDFPRQRGKTYVDHTNTLVWLDAKTYV